MSRGVPWCLAKKSAPAARFLALSHGCPVVRSIARSIVTSIARSIVGSIKRLLVRSTVRVRPIVRSNVRSITSEIGRVTSSIRISIVRSIV